MRRYTRALRTPNSLWQRQIEEEVVGKMRRAWLFIPILLVVYSTPVFAQGEKKAGPKEGDPVVGEADIRIQPGQDEVEVTEQITLKNAESLEEIEHIFTRFGDTGPEDLVVIAEGQELRVDYQEGDLVDRVFVPLPEGTSGDFSYEVSYRYPESGDTIKVPLVVPTVPTVGDANRVALKVTVPEGQYLQSSFPIITSGSTGTVGTNMIAFPNYTNFELGTSPTGIFTRSNVYAVVGIVLILGFIVAPLLYERWSATRKATNV